MSRQDMFLAWYRQIHMFSPQEQAALDNPGEFQAKAFKNRISLSKKYFVQGSAVEQL